MKRAEDFAGRLFSRAGLRFAKAAFEIARLPGQTVCRNISEVWSKQTTSKVSFRIQKFE
jgi:hypothetical protein